MAKENQHQNLVITAFQEPEGVWYWKVKHSHNPAITFQNARVVEAIGVEPADTEAHAIEMAKFFIEAGIIAP